jgi:flagellar biosynthesis/type III secretory pathway chaperone
MTIKRLTEFLTVQLRLLEELLALLERETGELAKINLDAMTEINVLKEDVTKRIEEHTILLRREIEKMAASAGRQQNCTLGEFAVMMKKQGNKEIPRLHHELNKVAERVRQVAAMNREIAERFAKTVSQSLGFLTQILNQSHVYGASGGFKPKKTGAVMINREA